MFTNYISDKRQKIKQLLYKECYICTEYKKQIGLLCGHRLCSECYKNCSIYDLSTCPFCRTIMIHDTYINRIKSYKKKYTKNYIKHIFIAFSVLYIGSQIIVII